MCRKGESSTKGSLVNHVPGRGAPHGICQTMLCSIVAAMEDRAPQANFLMAVGGKPRAAGGNFDGSGRCPNRTPQANFLGIWHLSHSEFHQEMRTTCSSLESQSGCPVQLSTRAPSPDRASFNCFPLEYRPPVKRAGGPPPLDSDRASREIIFLLISIALRARNFLLLIPIALRANLINSRRPD